MAQRRTKADPFADLTWDDLEEWAGSTIVSRGRGYQRGNHVQELARTPTGGLVAWVYGTHKYATRVEVEDGELSAICSCPYGGTCKHAVAVVLVYLDHLKQQQEVPTATASDRRLKLLDELDEEEEWDEEDENDEWEEEEEDKEDQDEEEWEEDEDEDEEPAARATPRRANKKAADSLSSFLEQQSKEQLVELLKEQARRHSAVRQALQDQGNLLSGSVKKLVKTARSEIHKLGGEPDWDDDWRGERGRYGASGNYERIQQHLEALLSAGHADEVVALGKDLLAAGVREVEMIHDEGETAEALSSCLEIVFRALPQSSLAPAEQILWAVEAELNDEYDFCQGLETFWHKKHTAADWNIVADKFASRLKQYKSSREDDSFSRNYRRDRLTDWLIRALEGSGRQEEIIPLCEREAEETGSYFRLIDRLKQAKRWKEAEEWIHKGIKATQQRLPGIADQLRTAWREIREREKNWPQVAALYAEQFFQQPGLHTFHELRKAAERAKVWPEVEAAARHYLETGELPHTTKRTKKGQTIPPWPLPECEVKDTTERRKTDAPMLGVLIDIAIDKKQPDKVLHWYDQRRPTTAASGYSWRYGWFDEDRIAQAVVDAYPDRAIAMWKKIAEAQIAQTQVRAYETAAGYLRKIQRVLGKLKREREWKEYLAALRQANLRKPRCVEILDRLENRRILG
jgi:uncharacterized Zn finger protein